MSKDKTDNQELEIKVASSSLNKPYIYGLVLLALSSISSAILYYQFLNIKSLFLAPSLILAITLFWLTRKHKSSLEERNLQDQVERGIYYGALIYIIFSISVVLKIKLEFLNKLISFINIFKVIIQINIVELNIEISVLFSLIISVIFAYLFIKAKMKKKKSGCNLDIQVTEEEKEYQNDNKEGKNLSVGFLYKVIP